MKDIIAALKKNIKSHNTFASILFRIYLQGLFIYRSIKSIGISFFIDALSRIVLHGDINELIINRSGAKLGYYGHSFYWNYRDRNSLLGIEFTGSYEKEELRTMLNLIKTGMTVFDIGANYGLHTVLFASNVGKNGHVYSFEPLRSVHKELKDNVILNGYEKQVTVENIALSNKKGKAIIYIPKALGTGASSLRIRWSGENIKQTCMQTTLDDYVSANNIKRVDFIKCDVEGSEFFVFKGAKETIKRFRPPIFFEAIDNHTKLFGYTIQEEIEYLRPFSYNFFLLDGSVLKKTKMFMNGYYFALPYE